MRKPDLPPVVLTREQHIEHILREWDAENAPKQPAYVVAGWALNGLLWFSGVVIAFEVLRP